MGAAGVDERVAFGRGLLLLATALDRELDEPEVRVYWHALKGVPADVRREVFAAASERVWRRFPRPGDLKVLAADIIRTRREAAARLHLADCAHPGHWLEDGAAVRRCPCWGLAMAAMAAVGEPLALPAAVEEGA